MILFQKYDNVKPYVLLLMLVLIGIVVPLAYTVQSTYQWLAYITSLLTFAVTYVYVVFTYRILKANHQMIKEQSDSSAEQARPFIVVAFPSVDDSVEINIINVGNRPAIHINIQFDRDMSELKEKIAWGDDKQLTFSDQILDQPFLAPNSAIATVFANPALVIQELSDQERKFNVYVTYKDLSEKEFSHSYSIDLGAYIHNSKIRQYSIEHRLHQIANRLEPLKNIRDDFNALNSLLRKLSAK